MSRFLLVFIFLANVSLAQNSENDSLLCNSKNSGTDRLLLYDKDCFIWIKEDSTSLGIMYTIALGQFKTIGDTIYFSHPDSTRSKNKYYCYCKYKGHTFTGFQLYNVPETWPPGSMNRVYKDIFNALPSKSGVIGIFVNFKAVRRNEKVIFLDLDDPHDLSKEYIFCAR